MKTIDRKSIPPNQCFFTWDIHYACNYDCSYCFFHDTWEEEKKKNRYPGLARWKEVWDEIFARYGTAHLHISGGEPFHYPDFIELVEHLVKNFTVEFDTNLSFDVAAFVRRVGPARVKFATAFHPQFADFEEYIEKIKILKNGGYNLGVNFVAFPNQIKDMAYYKKRLDEIHVSFDIMPFRGKYQNNEYPQSYSEEEIKIICECDPRTAPRMLAAYGKKEETAKPSAEVKSPEPISANPHFGKLCRMGQMYAKIHANGNAYRCCLIKEPGLLGNLIDGTFKLYENEQICNYDKCSCWVAMVPGNEPNWLFHWKTPRVPGGHGK
ncbi:MAG: radical SAM protein [Elusimicrobia bacterium]|nr:radical SAM protein [Elusimicrobiota bacterium]